MPPSKTPVLDPVAFSKMFLANNPEIGLLVAGKVAHNPEIAVLDAMLTLYRVHLLMTAPERALELVSDNGAHLSKNDRLVRENFIKRAAGMVELMQQLYEIAVAPAEEPVAARSE